jgi:hypothetical protein
MNTLKEIKSGKTGFGLLVENDGYISMDEGRNKNLLESYKLKESMGDDFQCPYPFIVNAVFQKYGIKNANGRIYPEEVLKREVEKYQQAIQERRAYGECNHPDSTAIDVGRICLNIIELHWEGKTLVGQMEIPITEAFRRTGAITCLADQVAHFLLSGLKLGVSSRGIGNVEQKYGTTIVTDYELICWDLVSQPSTPNAWIGNTIDDLKPYIESVQPKENAKLLTDLNKFNEWLD